MTERAEYLRRAEKAEREAAELPAGYGRNELQRAAAAFRRIAALLEEAPSEKRGAYDSGSGAQAAQ